MKKLLGKARKVSTGVAIGDLCATARTSAERESRHAEQAFVARVAVPSSAQIIREKQQSPAARIAPAKRRRMASRGADGNKSAEKQQEAALGESAPIEWVALHRAGKALWEQQLPEDPTHAQAIFSGMEKLSRGLLTGNPRNTSENVFEFDVLRKGAAYRVIYQRHHESGAFVVLGIAKKGRGDWQSKILATAGQAWRSFLKGDATFALQKLDISAQTRSLRGRSL